MSIKYDPQTIIEGNRLRAQAEEQPSTFAEYNGAVDVIPPAGGMAVKNQSGRMAGQMGIRALELMNNPAARQQAEDFMNMFIQSNQGFEFNQARMMLNAPPAPPTSAPKEGDK